MLWHIITHLWSLRWFQSSFSSTHQFGLLGIYGVTELQKSLELIIFGECDYLHDGSKLGEDLREIRAKSC